MTDDLKSLPSSLKDEDTAHVIVFGNEKGGSGKSTSAMHTAIALLRLGYKVGTIDLDARQGTLTRYMSNRWQTVIKLRSETPSPSHMAIEKSKADTVEEQKKQDRDFLIMALDELKSSCDFIVIDTPGTDSYLSRLAHGCADTLVTPMNDSFIDLDLLAKVDSETFEIMGTSIYSQMIMEQQDFRKDNDQKPIHWIVMRNRVSHIDAKNKMIMGDCLDTLSEKLGFTLVKGFGERVIFKELFLKGLTLLDLKEKGGKALTLSEISARQEVRHLIAAIGPEDVKGYPKAPGKKKIKKAND